MRFPIGETYIDVQEPPVGHNICLTCVTGLRRVTDCNKENIRRGFSTITGSAVSGEAKVDVMPGMERVVCPSPSKDSCNAHSETIADDPSLEVDGTDTGGV